MLLPRTKAEQRHEIYEDIRGLITLGFLAHPVTVNGARFVLRTLNDLDWKLLNLRAHGLSGKDLQTWVVAASIWMVDGMVLEGDEAVLYETREVVSAMPRVVIEDLYGIVNGLMRKLTASWLRLEAFLYEDESRELWRKEGSFLIARSHAGGSRNPVLKEWVMFNEHEDAMDKVTHEWALAKFTASPHAPKGIKKVTAQDAARDADLQRRRERVIDRTYYEVKGYLTREKEKPKKAGKYQEFRMAESEEEMHDEMQRWVAGIKDEHDVVVDGVKSRIRSEVEGRKEAERLRREAFAQALEEEGFPTTSRITPLIGSSGQAFVERMKARMPGTSKVYSDNTHNSAYEKYIKNDPSAGELRVTEDGQLVSGAPRDPRLLDLLTKPDTETPDLQQQVASRKPVATFEDDGET
jgi:hypothetical protein